MDYMDPDVPKKADKLNLSLSRNVAVGPLLLSQRLRMVNTSKLRRNGCQLSDDILYFISFSGKFSIWNQIWLRLLYWAEVK